MSTDSTKEAMPLSDDFIAETLTAISTYEGEFGRRFFLNGWNGDAREKWMEAVKWTKSFYESAHQRDNERIEELTGLVQELVDAVALTNGADTPMLQLTAFDARNTVLSKAKQSGFTPSTQ